MIPTHKSKKVHVNRNMKASECIFLKIYILELQRGSEEIPKQIVHHDTQTEGKKHRKGGGFMCLFLILFIWGPKM